MLVPFLYLRGSKVSRHKSELLTLAYRAFSSAGASGSDDFKASTSNHVSTSI